MPLIPWTFMGAKTFIAAAMFPLRQLDSSSQSIWKHREFFDFFRLSFQSIERKNREAVKPYADN